MTDFSRCFDRLSLHDKTLIHSFVYLRSAGLCLSCHNPDSDIHLNDHDGFCLDCSVLSHVRHVSFYK